MTSMWDITLGSPDVIIAVIDSGIDINHPDLLHKIIVPYDAYADDEDPSPNIGEFCFSGSGICDQHGTAVSGIALAAANNNSGIVGLCPDCTLLPIKMLGEDFGALSKDIAAFEHCIENNAHVINNSWGYTEAIVTPEPLLNVISRATTEPRDGKGAVVVFAAGNDDRELIDGELCTIPGVVCVSAIDSYGRPTAYTNFGDVDIAAPSATVSIAPGEELTTTFGGTSAAAPVVSGIAGWIISNQPNMSASDVKALLINTAVPSPLVTHDSQGHHSKYGYGVIDPPSILAQLYPEDDTKRGCNSLPLSTILLPIFLLFPNRKT